jgi:hypothetical protein
MTHPIYELADFRRMVDEALDELFAGLAAIRPAEGWSTSRERVYAGLFDLVEDVGTIIYFADGPVDDRKLTYLLAKIVAKAAMAGPDIALRDGPNIRWSSHGPHTSN